MRSVHRLQAVQAISRQASVEQIVADIEARWPQVVVSVTTPAPIVLPPLVLLGECERLGIREQ